MTDGLKVVNLSLLTNKKKSTIESKIQGNNFGRALILEDFINQFILKFSPGPYLKIAIVGGSKSEPEIQALISLGFSVDVTIFGLDNDNVYLDLNEYYLLDKQKEFDLILCSQVLEHIWNHDSFFSNLIMLMSPSTYLWLGCPASNRVHASPDYFSAGFTVQYLRKNLEHRGLKIWASGMLGSKRNYLATHLLPVWLSQKGHQCPILFAFNGRTFIVRCFFSFQYLGSNFFLSFKSPRILRSERFATETWILAQR